MNKLWKNNLISAILYLALGIIAAVLTRIWNYTGNYQRFFEEISIILVIRGIIDIGKCLYWSRPQRRGDARRPYCQCRLRFACNPLAAVFL